MRLTILCSALLPLLAGPMARAATPAPERPVARIDSLIATQHGNRVLIQARGAVGSGGWKAARLRPVRSGPGDARTLIVNFVATPPPSAQAVIEALLPISASTALPLRPGVVSVRALSDSNEITTQILK